MCISLGYEYFRYKTAVLPWPSAIWNAFVTPKHAFILWMAARKRLPTMDRLTFLDVDDACILCVGNKESEAHLFFLCPFSSLVWRRIRDWLGITRGMSSISSALKWIKKEARGSSASSIAKKVALPCTVYHIWNARNRRMFEGKVQEVEPIVFKIKLHIYKTLFSLDPNVCVEF